MVREIVRDPVFLQIKSESVSQDTQSPQVSQSDRQTAADLLDTLEAHRGECVGMAANMIGVSRRIIAFVDGNTLTVMYNPEIIKHSQPYQAEEGCLSLAGTRAAKRFGSIKVRWLNENMQPRIKTYTGFTAQIIQHELDHCDGILI